MNFRFLFVCFILLAVHGIPVSISRAETLALEDAVQIALSSHQRIIQAQELYSARMEMETVAQSDQLPSIDAGFSYDHLSNHPVQTISGTDFVTNDKDVVHYEIKITQPLFTGFAISARKKLAELNVDMASYDLKQTQRRLALDVNIAALQLLQAEANQRLVEQQRKQFINHLEDIKAAYVQGMVPGNDRLKAEVALATVEQQLQTVISRVTLARSHLNLLIGRPQQHPLEIIEPAITPQPQQQLQPLIELALKQRPEIRTAELSLNSSDENIRLANSRNLPQVALVASYWRNGDNLSASHNSYHNNDNSSIGIHLDWNLFSGGGDRARLAASHHQKRAKRQTLMELQDMVRLQVEEALNQLKVAAKNQQTALIAQQQARENHRLSVLQFHENLISTNDLLTARTLLTRAEANLQAAHYGILLANARLSFALGQDPLGDEESN